MGLSKFFCLGNQNKGATPFKDYSTLAAQPSRPKTNVIRTWIDSLGILNLLGSSGPASKVLVGTQEDVDSAIALKHSNEHDHQHSNQSALDAVSGTNTGDQDLSHLMVTDPSNTISGAHSAAVGTDHIITGDNCFASGEANSLNEYAGHAEGHGHEINFPYCHAEGFINKNDAPYSHTEGMCALSYNMMQHVKASGDFADGSSLGVAQYSNIIARAETGENTPYDLFVGLDESIILMNNKMNAFRIMVVASDENITDGAAYEFKGLIKKGSTAASTAIIGSVSKTVIAESDATWDCNVSADTTNGAIAITITSDATDVVRWVAFVELVEVAFYS